MSEENIYSIQSGDIMHYSSRTFSATPKLKDGYSQINTDELEPIIRSGQYFSTIATKLDKISLELGKDNEVQIRNIQRIVDELLYIQSNYKIKKKKIK